jgi:hypothetical protein
MNPNDRKILKRALASLPSTRQASLESVLLQDADPASKNQNRPEFYYGLKGGVQASLHEDLVVDAEPGSEDQNLPEHYYGLPPKGVQASGVRTAKLMARQESILQKYMNAAVASGVRAATGWDELPDNVRAALRQVKDQETLWMDVDRWFMDNAPATRYRGASGKPVRLTPKEIARADYEIPDRPFTIVVRPQADGRYWVAAIDLNTGHPLLGWDNPNLGQMFVDEKSHIPSAVRMIGRDLHKFTGFATNMTDQMRHQHYKGVQASSNRKAVYDMKGAVRQAEIFGDSLAGAPPLVRDLKDVCKKHGHHEIGKALLKGYNKGQKELDLEYALQYNESINYTPDMEY